MKVFYSPAHLEHRPSEAFEGGRPGRVVELPQRVESVRAEVERRGIGPILAPTEFGMAPVARLHDATLVRFMMQHLGDASTSWRERDDAVEGQPWPPAAVGEDPDAAKRAFIGGTPLVKGTWSAALAAKNNALSAAQAIRDGAPSAFSLARPPGHHASADQFGGYCYLNNVAIAAQWLVDAGLRPAILDVDYHHGNGTQSIFYERPDVFFCSIHGDPSFAFPHFLGFATEVGVGPGEGANLNLPLPTHTQWDGYAETLTHALGAVAAHRPDVLLVSLGLDTFEADPISELKLRAEDYLRMGAAIAGLRLPTLFVFEGGYNLDALPLITVNALEGFEGG